MFTNGQYSDHEHWRIVSYTHTHTHIHVHEHTRYTCYSLLLVKELPDGWNVWDRSDK